MIHFKGGAISRSGRRTGLGSGFRGLLSYLESGKKGLAGDPTERVLHWGATKQLDGIHSPEQAAFLMRTHVEQHNPIKQPVYHFGVSLPKGEHLSPKEWDAVAHRLLAAVGATDHQAVWAVHRDTNHEHLHLAVNRVSMTEHKVLSLSHDIPKARKEVRRIEIDYGLTMVPEPCRSRRATLTQTARQVADRTQVPPLLERVRQQALGQLAQAQDWGALEGVVRGHGWSLEAARGGRGVVITHDGLRIGLSHVDRSLSGGKLADRYGETFRDYRRRVPEPPPLRAEHQPSQHVLEDRARELLEHLSQHQATFTETDLRRATAGLAHAPDVVERLLSDAELVRLGPDAAGQLRYTTARYLAQEYTLFHSASNLNARRDHALAPEQVHRHLSATDLSAEQRAAVVHAVTGGDFDLIVGRAGVGKTHLATQLRELYEQAGYRVRGMALAGKAAEGLQSEAGIRSQTLASFEHARARGADALNAGDVVVLDEAGMVDVPHFARILEHADQVGAKVIALGDPQQFEAIGAGDALRGLLERFAPAHVQEIRRQTDPWMRQASMDLAAGSVPEALNAYDSRGRLHPQATRQLARQELVHDYLDSLARNPTDRHLAITFRNVDVDAINAAVREARRSVLGSDVQAGQIQIASGDRILFTQNDRMGFHFQALEGGEPGVLNGTLATVVDALPGSIQARLDDGRLLQFDPAAYPHLRHAYAVTAHKAQGMTVDRTYVLADPLMDAKAMYVAMTRHRSAVDLHWDQESFGTRRDLEQVLAQGKLKDLAIDYNPERPARLVAEDVRELLRDPLVRAIEREMPEFYAGLGSPQELRTELDQALHAFLEQLSRHRDNSHHAIHQTLADYLPKIARLESHLGEHQRLDLPEHLRDDYRHAREMAEAQRALVRDQEARLTLQTQLSRHFDRAHPDPSVRQDLEARLNALDSQIHRHRRDLQRATQACHARGAARYRTLIEAGNSSHLPSYDKHMAQLLANRTRLSVSLEVEHPSLEITRLEKRHRELLSYFEALDHARFREQPVAALGEHTKLLKERIQIEHDLRHLRVLQAQHDAQETLSRVVPDALGTLRAENPAKPLSKETLAVVRDNLDRLQTAEIQMALNLDVQGPVGGRVDLAYLLDRVAKGDTTPATLDALWRQLPPPGRPIPKYSSAPLDPENRLRHTLTHLDDTVRARKGLLRAARGASSEDRASLLALRSALDSHRQAQRGLHLAILNPYETYRRPSLAQLQAAAVANRRSPLEGVASFAAYSLRRQVSPGRVGRELLGRLSHGVVPVPTSPLSLAFRAFHTARRIVAKALELQAGKAAILGP